MLFSVLALGGRRKRGMTQGNTKSWVRSAQLRISVDFAFGCVICG